MRSRPEEAAFLWKNREGRAVGGPHLPGDPPSGWEQDVGRKGGVSHPDVVSAGVRDVFLEWRERQPGGRAAET